MDLVGQRVAEQIVVWCIVTFAVLGFLVGYIQASFALMAQINFVGLVLVLLAVVPDWPWFNRDPLSFLPPLKADNPDTTSKTKKS